jgi:hypothetical protein
MAKDGSQSLSRSPVAKLLWIGLLVFLALLGGLALLAWLLGDTSLPMEYEGFD